MINKFLKDLYCNPPVEYESLAYSTILQHYSMQSLLPKSPFHMLSTPCCLKRHRIRVTKMINKLLKDLYCITMFPCSHFEHGDTQMTFFHPPYHNLKKKKKKKKKKKNLLKYRRRKNFKKQLHNEPSEWPLRMESFESFFHPSFYAKKCIKKKKNC